jgi:hypothetical protein
VKQGIQTCETTITGHVLSLFDAKRPDSVYQESHTWVAKHWTEY